jgi:hypothetical protein
LFALALGVLGIRRGWRFAAQSRRSAYQQCRSS